MINPVSIVEKIVQLSLLINKAMDSVQQNAKVCGDIKRTVNNVSNIASGLKNNTEAMEDRATRDALDHLEKTLQRALKLVQDCQKKQQLLAPRLRRLVTAPDLSKQLRDVKEDISQNVTVLNLALTSLAHAQRAKLPWQRQQQPSTQSLTGRSAMTPAPNGTRTSKTPVPQGYGTSVPWKAVAPVRNRS